MTLHFVEKAPYEKGFSTYFDARIRPFLQDTERKLLIAQSESKKRLKVTVAISVLLFTTSVIIGSLSPTTVVNLFRPDNFLGTLSVLFCLVIGLVTWTVIPFAKLKVDYKSKVLPIICDFYGDLSYEKKRPEGMQRFILESGIYPEHTRSKAEDFISGRYKGTQVTINELTLRMKRGKQNYIVFRGLSIILEFPKKFNGVTLIRKDKGKIGNWFESSKNMERVELEDPNFESKFEVHSTDQVEARYLLTTAFMERLTSLSKVVNGDNTYTEIQAIFKDSSLILAIPSSKNLFQAKPIEKSAYELENIHTFLEQMNDVFTLIDLLKLDRN